MALSDWCRIVATLATALTEVLGTKTAALLQAEFDYSNIEDLLRHYPRRYEQRGALTDLGTVEIGEHVTVQGQVHSFRNLKNKSRPGSRQEVVVRDGSGSLTLIFFNQPWREKELAPGKRGLFAGQVGFFNGVRQLAHPDYEILSESAEVNPEDYTSAFLPVYPATKKASSWLIERAIETVLAKLEIHDDPIDETLRIEFALMPLAQALLAIHQPKSQDEVEQAALRLKWDEALALQVVLAQQRASEAGWKAIAREEKPDGLLSAFDARLPFELTAGQQLVTDTISQELAKEHPMHRLLQGEVGSGKTVVALRAMLTVADSGGQAALLAPTEVLAAQHFRAITNLLGPLAQRGMLGSHDEGTGVTLLTGSLKTEARRQALLDITTGQAGIVIGTHALLEDRVDFYDLGLVVIDEQHRFGVEQRAALVAKAGSDRRPHVLVMTATPIPRTVAMTTFGALDISTLTELPKGRRPITTHVVFSLDKPAHLARAWERVAEEVAKGHQAYIVVPRIESTQGEQAPKDGGRLPIALEDLAPELIEGPLRGLRVGLLHGQMPAQDKDEAMRRFTLGPTSADGLDVLIATTVIEVGVDVPNATMMVIMDADRFGISQLHQLRGRVGRGSAPGLCLLVSDAHPVSPSRERLLAVASTTDGFELAELDLQQRKEGDVLGRDQSGSRSGLKLLNVLHDEDILIHAKERAESIVARDPELSGQPALARAVAALVSEPKKEFVQKS